MEDLPSIVPSDCCDRVAEGSAVPERPQVGAGWITLERRHAARPQRASLPELLLAEGSPFPIFGREREVGDLEQWLHSPAPIGVRCLVGPNGIGKTRLAHELCLRAEAHGWSAGFAAMAAIGSLPPARAAVRSRPTLVVVDEPVPPVNSPAAWFGFPDFVSHCQGPLRVLVLGTEREVCLEVLAQMSGTIAVSEGFSFTRISGIEAAEERRALMQTACRVAAQIGNLPPPAFAPVAQERPLSDVPLHLIMTGVVGALTGPARSLALSSARLAEAIASEEADRLGRYAVACNLPAALFTYLAACVTRDGGWHVRDSARLAQQEVEQAGIHLPASADYVADCLADALLSDCGRLLLPIRPRLLAQAFLSGELSRNGREAVSA